MRVSLRICGISDNDLMALREAYGRGFCEAVRACLRAAVRGAEYELKVPTGQAWQIMPVCNKLVTLRIDAPGDADVIEFLQGIPQRAKGDVVKALVRARYAAFPYGDYIRSITGNTGNTGGSLPGHVPAHTGSEEDMPPDTSHNASIPAATEQLKVNQGIPAGGASPEGPPQMDAPKASTPASGKSAGAGKDDGGDMDAFALFENLMKS